jgi:hypothetical protein
MQMPAIFSSRAVTNSVGDDSALVVRSEIFEVKIYGLSTFWECWCNLGWNRRLSDMRLACVQKARGWLADKLLLPRGIYNDRSEGDSDLEEELLEMTEDVQERSETAGAGSALPAGVSFGGV